MQVGDRLPADAQLSHDWETCEIHCCDLHRPRHIRGSGGSDVLHDRLDPVPANACCHGGQSVNSFLRLNMKQHSEEERCG